MAVATLSSKSQIVVPSDVRERLGLKPGDQIAVEIEGDHAVLRKLPRSPLDELRRLIDPKIYRGAAVDLEKCREVWRLFS